MSGNSRKRYTQRLYRSSSISRAAWPADTRRCIATNKAAQRRRIILLKGWGWVNAQHNHITTRFHRYYIYIVAPVRQQLITALMTSVMLLIMDALYQWHSWPLLAVIFIITCTTLFLLLAKEKQQPVIPHTMLPPSNEEYIQHTPLFEFPETPVPSTPLIRMLDTIDLSSSDVEHFILSTADHQSPNNQQKLAQVPQEQEDIQTSE